MKKIIFILSAVMFVSIVDAQTGIGTTAPVNKFQVETSAADPLTTGNNVKNGHLRLSGLSVTHLVDVGLMSTTNNFGTWIQARKKDDYTINYNLLLNPNGGNVGIGTNSPTSKLYVNGDITANSISGTSDIRFKTNIRPVENALDKVKALKGVFFNWNQIDFPEKDFGSQVELGFIAQEVEKIVPEIVSKDKSKEAYRSVKYDKLVALLVEAIKEQQKQIDSLNYKVNNLSKSKNKL